jgi:nucleotide-binding universal stress UspA family protein
MMQATTVQKIVVGVDGSHNSLAALRWAAAQADVHDAQLVAVHAYRTPGDPYQGAYGPAPHSVYQELRATATERLFSDVLDALGPDGHKVTLQVEPGSPAKLLTEAAQDAQLLGVGTRGQTGLAGLLMGSTAGAVLRHAPCTVVAVPGTPAGSISAAEAGEQRRVGASPQAA